jgi:hypothetical protein
LTANDSDRLRVLNQVVSDLKASLERSEEICHRLEKSEGEGG